MQACFPSHEKMELRMRKANVGVLLLLAGSVAVYGALGVVNAVEGTVKKVDRSAKTIVIETADGTDHTYHVITKTVVHGVKGTDASADRAWDGLDQGSKVVAHYTTAGGQDTVQEIDRVADDGLKTSTGTIDHIDRRAKVLVVKGADGTKQTYRLTDHAATDAGKDIAKGAEKSANVTVYYTEEAGHKVAHFFKSSV